MSRVELSLLGGFELRCDARAVRLPLGSQRLIAYLALRDRPLLRIHVAATLWTEASEPRSLANLRSALWRIPDLACAVLETSPGHVGLAREVAVDIREVISVVRRLLEQPAGADEQHVESSRLADDLLPDWYDDWVLVERERLFQLRLHALEQLAERATRLGQFGRAIDTALTAIAADPLRESAHRVLIKAHLAEGNGSAGMRQYEEYCRRLRQELGLGPSPQLRQIVEGISS
jgi:DNA-binding SARP family transcriptional activator